MSETDVFDGWQMWSVGCHWSRMLPDGRKVTLSTWACGAESGYQLTVNYESKQFPGIAEANAAYAFLAASAPGTAITAIPDELPAVAEG